MKDNNLTSARLVECMELRKMSATMLIKRIEKLSGEKILKGNISQYRKGTSISEHRIELISQALRINAGYLLLDDKGFTKSYEEYCLHKKLGGDPDFDRYAKLFLIADLIMTSDEDDYGNLEYISNDNKTFTPSDMENFYQKIMKKMKEVIQSSFAEYKSWDEYPENYTDRKAWVEFFAWHPDYFTDHPEMEHLKEQKAIKLAWYEVQRRVKK